MRMALTTLAMSAALVATNASAQGIDLTGRYRCVVLCLSGAPGGFAFITQNGWDLNLVNDAGEPSRGWIDYPGRLWVPDANQGAIYSVDGADHSVRPRNDLAAAIDEPLPPPGRRRR